MKYLLYAFRSADSEDEGRWSKFEEINRLFCWFLFLLLLLFVCLFFVLYISLGVVYYVERVSATLEVFHLVSTFILHGFREVFRYTTGDFVEEFLQRF